LRVRIPVQPFRQRSEGQSQLPSSQSLGPILSIYVTPNMTVDVLSACVLQACLHQPMPCLLSSDSQTRLVGLFSESKPRLFVSLEHLLTTEDIDERQDIYTTHLVPSPSPPQPPTPWWMRRTFWLLISLPLLLGVIVRHMGAALYYMEYSLVWLYHSVIQLPLRDLYRHGPWLLGWEGASLPQICARITFHGDELFWSRNLEECQRIYIAKEEAWLRVSRPLLWTVLFLLTAYALRFLVTEFRKTPPPSTSNADREMVEVYRAWQTLLRNFQRTVTPPAVTNDDTSNKKLR